VAARHATASSTSGIATLGRLDEAVKIADVLEPLATKIGQGYSIALCLSTRTWLEFVREPNLAKLEAGFQAVAKSDAKARFPFWEVLSEVQLSALDLFAATGRALYRVLTSPRVSTRK